MLSVLDVPVLARDRSQDTDIVVTRHEPVISKTEPIPEAAPDTVEALISIDKASTGFIIPRQTFAGGGGVAGSSPSFRLSGTMGQTAVGRLYGTDVIIVQGFSIGAGGPNGCCTMPGDANNDQAVNMGDGVFIINYIFKGGAAPPCLNEADANADCVVNAGDAVFIVKYTFNKGALATCGCAQ